MICLAMLKPIRKSRDISTAVLARLAGLPTRRVTALESITPVKQVEPWFDEALRISRTLGTHGILPLITSGSLTLSDCGPTIYDDHAIWCSNARLPLSVACRISIRFGLSDPSLLHVDPLMQELWAMIEQGERHPTAAGWCPVCVADVMGGETHLPTCLGNNLLNGRTGSPLDIGTSPRPHTPGLRRTGSAQAHGLRVLRESRGFRQQDMAELADIAENYYAVIERGTRPLSLSLAERIAAYFKVDVATVYAHPGDEA